MHQRIFTIEDQIAFAELSGDYNPVHTDSVAARRYIFGRPVVHGVHILLWALDNWFATHTEHATLQAVQARFLRPVALDEQVHCALTSEQLHCFEIEVLSGGSIATTIRIGKRQGGRENSEPMHSDCLKTCFPAKRSPRVLSEDELEADSGSLDLCLNIEAAAKLFPHLTRCVSPRQIAVILCTTRLVGVKCPGLHSIYSELDLAFAAAPGCATLNYEVSSLDRRFGLASIKVSAPGITGVLKAFLRPAPQEQASFLKLKGQVESNEFALQRALVIGGSRGLGEVAAKFLSAGGAHVTITYHRGREDARRVVDDIVANGGRAASCHFDVLNPRPDAALSASDHAPTHLYYFATPVILPGVKGSFSSKRFNDFCDYYVTGFFNTVNQFGRLGTRNIFYPSTVFIDELPASMGEYAAAKTAGETLCAFLEKTSRGMRIYRPRFPRMATDQTVSLLRLDNQDPAPIMIRSLRFFRDFCNGAVI